MDQKKNTHIVCTSTKNLLKIIINIACNYNCNDAALFTSIRMSLQEEENYMKPI